MQIWEKLNACDVHKGFDQNCNIQGCLVKGLDLKVEPI